MVLLRTCFFALLFLLPWSLLSQVELMPHDRHVIELVPQSIPGNVFILPKLKTKNAPLIALSIKSSPPDFKKIRYRMSEDDPWLSLQEDVHVSGEHFTYSSLLFLEPKRELPEFMMTDPLSSTAEMHFYNPGVTAPDNIQYSKMRSDHCECVATALIERDSWCDQCPKGGPLMNEDPEFIVLHHSAGANSSSDWAAVVRSIWDFHVNVRGWDDIGYNYLIDPEGRTYAGRGDDRLGAHFCGTNTGTLGICMLGTYSGTLPPKAALDAIGSLTAWQSCIWEINPLDTLFHSSSGELLPTVCGHRQGCATECPGQDLFEHLPEIRLDVHTLLEDCDTIDENETVLQARLMDPFIAVLEWNTLLEEAHTYLLQYKEVGEDTWRDLRLSMSDRLKEIGLQPNKKYTFRIKSIFPLSVVEFSNEVELETGDWTHDQAEIRLYPNPANERLTIRIVNDHYGPMGYAVFDMNSKKVKEETVLKDASFQEFLIESWDLPEGVYILHVTHPEFQHDLKFIVHH